MSRRPEASEKVAKTSVLSHKYRGFRCDQNGLAKMDWRMKTLLRILYLEDDPRDAELVQEMLAAGGIECAMTRVETETDFTSALDRKAHV